MFVELSRETVTTITKLCSWRVKRTSKECTYIFESMGARARANARVYIHICAVITRQILHSQVKRKRINLG